LSRSPHTLLHTVLDFFRDTGLHRIDDDRCFQDTPLQVGRKCGEGMPFVVGKEFEAEEALTSEDEASKSFQTLCAVEHFPGVVIRNVHIDPGDRDADHHGFDQEADVLRPPTSGNGGFEMIEDFPDRYGFGLDSDMHGIERHEENIASAEWIVNITIRFFFPTTGTPGRSLMNAKISSTSSLSIWYGQSRSLDIL